MGSKRPFTRFGFLYLDLDFSSYGPFKVAKGDQVLDNVLGEEKSIEKVLDEPKRTLDEPKIILR